jgi:MYXO-CTERM domain-containing protein
VVHHHPNDVDGGCACRAGAARTRSPHASFVALLASGGNAADGEGSDSGCGCALPGEDRPWHAFVTLALLGAALVRRRRRG